MLSRRETILREVNIARGEQVTKHGYDAVHDAKRVDYELTFIAMYLAHPLDLPEIFPLGVNMINHPYRMGKMEHQRLIDAMACLLAEIERIDILAEGKDPSQLNKGGW